LPHGQDCTLYEGISIGKILEIEMWYYWRDLFEQIETLKRLIALVCPAEIYLATTKNEQISRLLQEFALTDVPVCCLRPSLVSRLSVWRDAEGVRQRLKAHSLDRFVRLAALYVDKFRHGRNAPTGDTAVDVLALLEQPAPYLADSILPILAFFPRRGILLMDPRHRRRAIQSGSQLIYQTDFLKQPIRQFWRLHKVFEEYGRVCLPQVSQALHYQGKNLAPIVADKLRHLFRWVFPLVALEINGARQLFADRAVRALLLVTDAHHGGRLYTLVADQQGIPSLVVQHGATMGDWGYVPLYATRFAAWGEMSADWMAARGTPRDRLVITGQPRLDSLRHTPRTLTRQTLSERLNLPQDGFWLLWAMDPIPKPENDHILHILIETISVLPWCHLVIRPHPGIQQLGWISERARERERIVLSSTGEPLYDLLYLVDALVIQGSTVGVEAMAMDKPVLVLQHTDSPANTLYVESGATTRASDAAQLAAALREVYACQQAGTTDALAPARHEFVRRYLLSVDGHSAERVAQALAALRADG
jgi:hypothetical protein